MLTKAFRLEQYADALESWAWIGIGDRTPVLCSLFGHVFLRDDEGYWYLDVIGGSLELIWPNAAALQAALDTDDGQDEFLLGGIALAAEQRGVTLGADQVYDFMPPPALGGAFDVANVTATAFVVAVNIAGQIHGQLRALPPGTNINQVTVDVAPPPKAKFWRRRSP